MMSLSNHNSYRSSLISFSCSSKSDEDKQTQFSSHQVSILNIESPASIFVRRVEDEDTAHGIDAEMSTYYEKSDRENNFSFQGLVFLTPGRRCALHHTLQSCSWHRAILLTTTPPHFTARLLDRGLTITAPTNKAFPLPDFLADLETTPPMALR